MLVCVSCKQGLMDPVIDEEEPEYTDRYRCSHCGHTTTIASRLIVFTQVISAVLGGAITLYLMLNHLVAAISAWRFDQNSLLTSDMALGTLAAALLAGFGYTLFRAAHNVYKRRRYLDPTRKV